MRILMITCEWPTEAQRHLAPFVVRQVEFLRKAGVEVDVFAFRGAKNPLNYVNAWFQVRQRMRSGLYDVVHAQWGQSALVAMPTRLPLVITDRGGEGPTVIGRLLRVIASLAARYADELVVVSSHLRQHLPNRQSHVIPSGLDFGRLPLIPPIEARRQLGLPLSKLLVLFVGNPDDARKRYGLARDVMSRLPSTLNAELVVVWGLAHEQVIMHMNACDALLFVQVGRLTQCDKGVACLQPAFGVHGSGRRSGTGEKRRRLRRVRWR
jgi:teichuronic acid biosynthesis glycosyltransferase TuaC